MSDRPTDSKAGVLAGHRWDQTIPRLVDYARGRMRVRVWAGRRDGPLPGGKEAEDVVYEAIEKVMDGRRAWDPESHPDVEAYLRDVIESDLNHLAVGFENRRFIPASLAGLSTVDEERVPVMERVPSPAPPPPAHLEMEEERREAEAFRGAFLRTLADEPRLTAVVEGIFEGADRPGELAEKTGVPVKEIYNIRKRLQRRLLDFYGKWSQTQEDEGGGDNR